MVVRRHLANVKYSLIQPVKEKKFKINQTEKSGIDNSMLEKPY